MPLVLGIVFIIMLLIGLDLHRITLGALIIALGLMVDDAIIAVEMMLVKMEQGVARAEAAGLGMDLDRLSEADRSLGDRRPDSCRSGSRYPAPENTLAPFSRWSGSRSCRPGSWPGCSRRISA